MMDGSPDVNVPGEHLWNYSRLRQGATAREVLLLVLWAPIGCLLLALRAFAWPLGILGYPLAHCLGCGRRYMQLIQPIWSVRVTVRGLENLDGSSAPIIAANHVSDFDACAIWAANPPAEQRLLVNEHWKPVISAAQRLGWPIDPIYTNGGNAKEALTKEVAGPAGAPGVPQKRVLLFPEGRTSSGIAVMPFFDFAFSLGAPIVPCAVRVRNPWPLQMQMNGTSVLCNLAALYWLPYVEYEVTFLPEVSGKGLSKEQYAEAVRGKLLQQLGVPSTLLTAKDKVAFGAAQAERRREPLRGRRKEPAPPAAERQQLGSPLVKAR